MNLLIYDAPLLILAIAWLFQVYYQLFVYTKLRSHPLSELPESPDSRPVSVVICARNEEKNLAKFLPVVLEQDYPNFEVVVVNDCSSDESKWLLKTFSEQYSHLKVVNINEHIRYKHGKKFAATIGIKASSHEHLVFTDADCQPGSAYWLQHIMNAFAGDKEIVLGYSPYFKARGFLNLFIRFETFHTALSYLSYSLKGCSYMGVGRNMAYMKSLFFQGKGFASHLHIPSGDDDLFVNQNATRHNTAICIDPQAQVWSEPKRRYKDYFIQKARHHGASEAYRGVHKRMLSSQLISAIIFYIALLVCFVLYPLYWELLLIVYLLRLLIQIIVYQPIMKRLQVLDILVYLPILDLFYYFYTCLNGFVSLFRRQEKWK